MVVGAGRTGAADAAAVGPHRVPTGPHRGIRRLIVEDPSEHQPGAGPACLADKGTQARHQPVRVREQGRRTEVVLHVHDDHSGVAWVYELGELQRRIRHVPPPYVAATRAPETAETMPPVPDIRSTPTFCRARRRPSTSSWGIPLSLAASSVHRCSPALTPAGRSPI